MKLPQDTTGNKAGSTLLPAVSNQAGDGLAARTKRGFAESLHHQISIVAGASAKATNADLREVSAQSDANKSGQRARGTDLPAHERKLPRANDSNIDSTQPTPGSSSAASATSDPEASGLPGRTTDTPDNARGGDDRLDSDSNQNPRVTVTSTASPAHESDTNARPSRSKGHRETDAQQTDAEAQSPGIAAIVTEASSAQEWAPADLLERAVWNGSLTGAAGMIATSTTSTPDALWTVDGTEPMSPSSAPLLAAASGLTSGIAGRISLTTPVATDGVAEHFLPETRLLPGQPSLQASGPGLAHSGLPNLPLQNPVSQHPAASQTTPVDAGQQTSMADDAISNDFFDSLLQAGSGTDGADNGISFSNRLLGQQPTLPTSLQYASMLAQPGQQPGGYTDAPASGLMQSLVSAQQALAATLEPVLSPASSSATSPSSSGLSAALYSQEQRHQVAAEARSVQVQHSRALDTSLSTTSALKLPGLDATFGQAGWIDRIGRQMLLQSAQGSSSAQIRLDPPELGSLTVKIQLVDQTAAVNFVSPHAMVRDALEQQSGRLQEMFREQGIELADVSVSDQSTHSGGGEQKNSNGTASGSSTWLADDSSAPAQVSRESASLIDYYA